MSSYSETLAAKGHGSTAADKATSERPFFEVVGADDPFVRDHTGECVKCAAGDDVPFDLRLGKFVVGEYVLRILDANDGKPTDTTIKIAVTHVSPDEDFTGFSSQRFNTMVTLNFSYERTNPETSLPREVRLARQHGNGELWLIISEKKLAISGPSDDGSAERAA